MNKIWLVFVNELIVTIRRPSFLFSALGIPLISTLALVVIGGLNRSAPQAIAEVFSVVSEPAAGPEGYVDLAGLIRSLPADLPAGRLAAYPDEAAAAQAVQRGEISAYYVIAADYLKSGSLTYVRPDFNPLAGLDQAGLMRHVLRLNLLGGDEGLTALVEQPLQARRVPLSPQSGRDETNPLTFAVPYVTMMIYYITILMAASYLLNSLTKEKENRVLEILMVSLSPLQMLTGKILALGVVGLVQIVLWVGTGYLLVGFGGVLLALAIVMVLPLSFLFWALIFFLVGYALYASLMAAVGALVPNLREASQLTFIVILPLIIPLMLISVMIEDPHGALSTGLSLFPLTAPVVMMVRLAAGNVPGWQPPLAALLVAGSAGLLVAGVARLFRAQTLLAGQAFSLKRLVEALRGG